MKWLRSKSCLSGWKCYIRNAIGRSRVRFLIGAHGFLWVSPNQRRVVLIIFLVSRDEEYYHLAWMRIALNGEDFWINWKFVIRCSPTSRRCQVKNYNGTVKKIEKGSRTASRITVIRTTKVFLSKNKREHFSALCPCFLSIY